MYDLQHNHMSFLAIDVMPVVEIHPGGRPESEAALSWLPLTRGGVTDALFVNFSITRNFDLAKKNRLFL